MGPGLALALMAGGTAAQMVGQHQQQRDRRKILNREMERSDKTQSEATKQVLDEASNFSPDKRMQSMQAAEQQAFQQAQTDTGGGAAANIPTAAGNVSADYIKARADKVLSEGDRLTAIAREAAKVRAPGQMQNDEAGRRANLAGELGSKWSTTRNMNQAGQMDADSIEEPWYGQLGKLASAVGSGAMMGPAMAGGAGTLGVTGANGAFLGEAAAQAPWWQQAARGAAMAAPRIRFGGR